MRRRLCVASTALCAGLAPRAGAQPSPRIPPLVYQATPACPDEGVFARRLLDRVGGSAPLDSTRRTLKVRIVRSNGQYVGAVSILEDGGHPNTKTLTARDCDALVDALSLVAALAIRPGDVPPADGRSVPSQTGASGAGTAPTQAGDAAQSPASGPGSEAGSPASDRTSTEPSSTSQAGAQRLAVATDGPAVRGAVAARPRPEADAESPSSPAGRSATFGVALGGFVAVGNAPEPLFGGSLGAEWTATAVDSGFSPAVGLGVAAGAAPTVNALGGKASFAWFGARTTACPVRWKVAPALGVRACLLGDLGVENASGSDTLSPFSSWKPWLSLGASSRAEWSLAPGFALHISVGAEAPLRRDRYAFAATDFFEVPVIVVIGAASAVAYFR